MIEIPRIGLGTYGLGEKCLRVVETALRIGYRHIDTAYIYGNQTEIGKAIKISEVPRKDIFLVSKKSAENVSHDAIIDECHKTLEELGTSYLDLYLIHWPADELEKMLQPAVNAFCDLYNEKVIKNFGVSNFEVNHLKELRKVISDCPLKLSVNQIHFSPFAFPRDLYNFCKNEKIHITAYSPLEKGEVNDNETLIKIAEKHHKSPAQISLRWLLDKGVSVIPKASSLYHLRENFNLNFKLSDNETKEIDLISRI